MIDLDESATAHIEGLAIPAGPGVQAIRERGRRRRRRRAVASSGVACLVAACLVGVGVVVLLGDRSQSVSAVDGGPAGSAIATVDLDTELRVLDDWNAEDIPVVPTPSLVGWTVETIGASTDRYYSSGSWSAYSLRAGSDELILETLSGQVELSSPGKDPITLDRPQGPVPAALQGTGEDMTLLWNERPGVNTGTAVTLRGGDDLDALVAAGEAVVFNDLPLTGATTPRTQPLAPSRVLLLQGVTSGVEWQVTRLERELPVLEVDGRAPVVTGHSVSGISTDGPEVVLSSISYDGRQLNMLRIPIGATAELHTPANDKIALPTVEVEATTYSIAVAPIPAGKQASIITVTDSTGSQTLVGLPWAPETGWSTMTLSFENLN